MSPEADEAAMAGTLDTPDTLDDMNAERDNVGVFGDNADTILALAEKYATKLETAKAILDKLQDAVYQGPLKGKLDVDVSKVYDGIASLITDLTVGLKARAVKEANKKAN